MKKLISCMAFAFILLLSLHAQNSEKMTEILKSEKASFEQASYLPALYANLISEDDSSAKAFEALKDNNYFSPSVTSDSNVTLAQLCQIYMKAFNMKGGLFYTLFPSARYAFKEFKANGILPPQADPSENVSGRDSIDIFNSCLSLTGGNE